MGNYPQLPNTQTGAEQNFLSTIYGNNFMLSLGISMAQKKKFVLLISLFFFSIKLLPWFLAKDLWESEELAAYMKLELSFKDKV